eukprot:5768741-Prymnesium_polylepis.2
MRHAGVLACSAFSARTVSARGARTCPHHRSLAHRPRLTQATQTCIARTTILPQHAHCHPADPPTTTTHASPTHAPSRHPRKLMRASAALAGQTSGDDDFN